MMFSGTPELWPSPCPGAPSIIGSCQPTPGFCEACGMSSMSLPSEITGLPEPQLATQAVGMPATPRWILKPSFSRIPVRYLEVSIFLEAQFAEAEDAVHHDLRLLLHGVDLSGEVGLHGGFFFGSGLGLRHPQTGATAARNRGRVNRRSICKVVYTAAPSR